MSPDDTRLRPLWHEERSNTPQLSTIMLIRTRLLPDLLVVSVAKDHSYRLDDTWTLQTTSANLGRHLGSQTNASMVVATTAR